MTYGSLASGAIESSPFARGQGKRVILEGNARVRLVMRAIERVDAVAAQRHDRGAVGVEYHRGFVITLLGAGCDRLARRFDRERRRDAVRLQRITIAILETCFIIYLFWFSCIRSGPSPCVHSGKSVTHFDPLFNHTDADNSGLLGSGPNPQFNLI